MQSYACFRFTYHDNDLKQAGAIVPLSIVSGGAALAALPFNCLSTSGGCVDVKQHELVKILTLPSIAMPVCKAIS